MIQRGDARGAKPQREDCRRTIFCLFFCALFLCLEVLEAEENITLTGFIYSTADGQKILSDQPQLKSCCIGNPTANHWQVGIEPSLPISLENQKVYTLKGELVSVEEKKAPPFFALSNVEVIQRPSFFEWRWEYLTLIGFFSASILSYFNLFKRATKKR